MLSFELRGINELLRIANANLGPMMREILHDVAELVQKEMSKAPGPVKKPINWASDKQRRYVMMLVRKYGPWVRGTGFAGGGPRSQNITKAWSIHAESDYRTVLRNSASYGPWVQGWFDQQTFHRETGWGTDQDALDIITQSREIERIVSHEVDRVFGGKA